MTVSPVAIKRLPELNDPAAQRSFLHEIKELVEDSRQPRLIFDLSSVPQIDLESIDLLLECVDHAERSDGEVCVTGASRETEVLLELTQANSVLSVLASAPEAANGSQSQAA